MLHLYLSEDSVERERERERERENFRPKKI